MYRRALQKDLRYGEAYYRLGLTDLKLQSYSDAARMLLRAVELQPNNTDATTKLADLYMVAALQGGPQTTAILKEIKDLDLGRLSATGQVGRYLLVVRKSQMPDGNTRIVAVFERWQRIREVRGGYRSTDYPFGIMEIIVNAKGKGSGTFIAACKIDLKRDKKSGKYQLELENFGTYPHKVMGVMLRK